MAENQMRSAANRRQLEKVHAALLRLLEQTLVSDFGGTVALEFTVEQGTLQRVRSRVERHEK